MKTIDDAKMSDKLRKLAEQALTRAEVLKAQSSPEEEQKSNFGEGTGQCWENFVFLFSYSVLLIFNLVSLFDIAQLQNSDLLVKCCISKACSGSSLVLFLCLLA